MYLNLLYFEYFCIVIKFADKMGLKQKETKGKKEVKKKSKTDSNVDIGKVSFHYLTKVFLNLNNVIFFRTLEEKSVKPRELSLNLRKWQRK